jgi:predicted nucleic acid-binding protein
MSNGGLSPGPHSVVDVVVDASVAVKWFVPENHSSDALRLLDARFRRHIPVLLHTEVGQTIWKKIYQRKEIAAADGRSILRGLMVTALEVHAMTPLLEPAFDIALATGRTVYDSIYLALATALGCKFVTADQKLHNALRNGPFAADVLWVADLNSLMP